MSLVTRNAEPQGSNGWDVGWQAVGSGSAVFFPEFRVGLCQFCGDQGSEFLVQKMESLMNKIYLVITLTNTITHWFLSWLKCVQEINNHFVLKHRNFISVWQVWCLQWTWPHQVCDLRGKCSAENLYWANCEMVSWMCTSINYWILTIKCKSGVWDSWSACSWGKGFENSSILQAVFHANSLVPHHVFLWNSGNETFLAVVFVK